MAKLSDLVAYFAIKNYIARYCDPGVVLTFNQHRRLPRSGLRHNLYWRAGRVF